MISTLFQAVACIAIACAPQQEPLGEYWGTDEEESKYYELVDVPLPKELAIEAGSFEVMPDKKQLAIATVGAIFFLASGVFDEHPQPKFKKLPADWMKSLGWLTATDRFMSPSKRKSPGLRISTEMAADRFDTLSDDWGFRNYHELLLAPNQTSTEISGSRSVSRSLIIPVRFFAAGV